MKEDETDNRRRRRKRMKRKANFKERKEESRALGRGGIQKQEN